jgi:hypothetical protein
MNWDGPSAAMATLNYRWADYLKSCKMSLWEARAHLQPGIMLAKTSSFLEMGCRAMSTYFQTLDTYGDPKTTN